MKIGINLVGVSYNDGSSGGRYRNYQDSADNFFYNIVEPLKNQGHEISFYLFSYENEKQKEIEETYLPCKKSTFLDTAYNTLSSGDKINGIKIMSLVYINSLQELLSEHLDLVISTRFDIDFLKNPFTEFDYDFQKFNFLSIEPEYTSLPIVNDTFMVFPHSMVSNLINAIYQMETQPPFGINIAMHNLYIPMADQVGKDNIKIVCDNMYLSKEQILYRLTRHE
jgi:hypothetical protein